MGGLGKLVPGLGPGAIGGPAFIEDQGGDQPAFFKGPMPSRKISHPSSDESPRMFQGMLMGLFHQISHNVIW